MKHLVVAVAMAAMAVVATEVGATPIVNSCGGTTCIIGGVVNTPGTFSDFFNLALGTENFSEERTIEAGDKVVVVESPYGRIGLSICYDLRFPELYRAMGNVDIIVVPSAFTATTGKAHWETLIRARAIENLAYVIAPAQGGFHVNGRETHGDSMIVDPWGVVLDHLPRGSGVVVAGINPQYQQTIRKSLPALTHRTLRQV